MAVVKWYLYYIDPKSKMPVRINFLRKEDADSAAELLDLAGVHDWVVKQFEE